MARTRTRRGTATPPTEPLDADVYVLGGGPVGATVARRLHADDHAVALVDDTQAPADVPARRADPTDVLVLDEVGLETATTVIVATPSDGRNLLVAQLVRVWFDVDRVLVLTNDPQRVVAMADGGHEPVCATTALADAIVDHL